MGSAKTFALLTVVTVVAVAGVYLTQRGSDDIPLSGQPLVPGMLTTMNKVRAVEVTGSGKSFRIEDVDGKWVIPARENYLASAQRMQQLLVGMSELVRIEPKTAKPDLYPKVGLGDPASAGDEDEMVRFTLYGDKGEKIVTITVGNRQEAKGNPNLNEYYLLKDDDPQVWLVQGRLPLERELMDWIDAQVIGLEPERVAQTVVEHPDEQRVIVTREQPHENDFTLVNQPPRTKIKEKWQVEDIGRGIARVEFADVRKASLDDLEGETGFVASMRTHDGMRVVVRTKTRARSEQELAADADLAPRVFAVFEASFDEKAVNQALLEKRAANLNRDVEAMERGPERREAEALRKLEPVERVRAEVETLNRKWAGWVYELPEFKATHLLRKVSDLVEADKAEEGPAPGPAPAPSSS